MAEQLTKRSKIAYDLSISPHKTEVVYGDEKLVYVFSSELYRNIFENKVMVNREKVNNSLSKRFKIEIKNNKLADINLYRMTEKRGFLIQGMEEYSCLGNLKLDGVSLTNKS